MNPGPASPVGLLTHQKSTSRLNDNRDSSADRDHGSPIPGSRLTGLSFFPCNRIHRARPANRANRRAVPKQARASRAGLLHVNPG